MVALLLRIYYSPYGLLYLPFIPGEAATMASYLCFPVEELSSRRKVDSISIRSPGGHALRSILGGEGLPEHLWKSARPTVLKLLKMVPKQRF